MRVIIFGLGKIYRDNISKLSKEDEIIAYVDNDTHVQGNYIDGIKVISPAEIVELKYDKILIMTLRSSDIKSQLLKLGVKREKILFGLQYIYSSKHFDLSPLITKNKKNVLLVTNSLGYHGGAMACIFMAKSLKKIGYHVSVAAPVGNSEFIESYQQIGMQFAIMEGIQFAKLDNIKGVNEFDLVIVNTYPMILLAIELSSRVKTMLWIHESKEAYLQMDFWLPYIRKKLKSTKLKFFAVSEVARDIFREEVECPKDKISILECGLMDDVNIKHTYRGEKVTFAVIGSIYPLKQQNLFVDAVELLANKQKNDNRFWIIGKIEDKEFAEKLLSKIENKPYLEYLGEKSQEELGQLFNEIDVVVVCSKQETLSIVALEAFMRNIPCIICDNAGIARYVTHKTDSYVCKTNDVIELANAMTYFLDNKENMDYIGQNARKVYEDRFSSQKFELRLETIIKKLEELSV